MKTKKITLIGLGAVLLIAVTFAVLQATHITHFFEPAAQKQKQQATQYENNKKATTVVNGGNPSSTDSKGNTAASTGTYTPPNNTDNITITPTRQNDQVVLRIKLKGYSDGSCALTITNDAKSTSQTAQVVYAPDFSTCAGFSIPVSTLGSGNWNISLAVTSGGITTNQSSAYTVQ